MMNFYFRVNEYFGFVSAPDHTSLFWKLDEYSDPHSMLLKRGGMTGFCTKLTNIFEDACDYSELELSAYNHILPLDFSGWRMPIWTREGSAAYSMALGEVLSEKEVMEMAGVKE